MKGKMRTRNRAQQFLTKLQKKGRKFSRSHGKEFQEFEKKSEENDVAKKEGRMVGMRG